GAHHRPGCRAQHPAARTDDPRHGMNRRDFLHPRQLTGAAGQVLGAASELQSAVAAEVPEEVALLRLGWRAMATRFEILVPFDTPGADAAGQAAFTLLDALEDQLTV